MAGTNINVQPNVNNSSVVLAAQPSEIGARQTMSSLEIAEEVGKPHKDLLKSIRKMEPAWTKVCGGNFTLTSRPVQMPNGGYRNEECYEFNYEEFIYVISKFDDERRARLVMRWRKVETGQATPMYQVVQQQVQQSVYSLEEKFKAIELSCKMLRKSKASKARMVNAVIVPMGLPAFEYIESEGQFLAATKALNKFPVIYKGKNLSAVTFNKILVEKGYLEDVPQTGKSPLKLLTEKGEKWGKNEDSVDHPGSIIAHYNMKKFPEFLKELGLK